jgi:5-enolpyruvylshikimate-3-phosphate synthase
MAVDGDIRVSDSKCINKSYPDYYSDYKKLGGKAYGIYMG